MLNTFLEGIIAFTFVLWLASIIRIVIATRKIKGWLILLFGIVLLFIASSFDVVGDVINQKGLAFEFKNFSYSIGVVLFSVGFLQMANRTLRDMKELENQAIFDDLTKLLNRRGFLHRLSQEMERSKRFNSELDLLVLDLNNFKLINDTYGHAIGDEVLKKVAICLKNELRSYDVMGRIGGDEFAIFLPDSCLEESQKIAERLKIVIENAFTEMQYKVAVAIGVACFPKEANTIDSLFVLSDKRMYHDKRNAGKKEFIL